jgi:hypothetical protein
MLHNCLSRKLHPTNFTRFHGQNLPQRRHDELSTSRSHCKQERNIFILLFKGVKSLNKHSIKIICDLRGHPAVQIPSGYKIPISFTNSRLVTTTEVSPFPTYEPKKSNTVPKMGTCACLCDTPGWNRSFLDRV